jgi:ribosomal protein S1
LEKDIEALLHISELKEPAKEKPADIFKVGDKVKAKVAKADLSQRKITLTQKE